MKIEEIDKWLDNEYGVSYTRLEELRDFVAEQYTKYQKEAEKEIERLTKQNKALNEMYELTKKEYIRLNNTIKTKDEGIKAFTKDLCEESTKIEKTIEYIEKHTENIDRGQYYEDYVETYPVLQILKGSDK